MAARALLAPLAAPFPAPNATLYTAPTNFWAQLIDQELGGAKDMDSFFSFRGAADRLRERVFFASVQPPTPAKEKTVSSAAQPRPGSVLRPLLDGDVSGSCPFLPTPDPPPDHSDWSCIVFDFFFFLGVFFSLFLSVNFSFSFP